MMPVMPSPRGGQCLQNLSAISKLLQSHIHTSNHAFPSTFQAQLQATFRNIPQRSRVNPYQLRLSRSYASKTKPKPSKKSAKPTKTPTTFQTIPHPPTQQPTILPHSTTYSSSTSILEQTLAAKASPTLLFLATSSNAHAITCIGVSASAILYGFYHLHDAYVVPHPGLWWAIPHLLAGVSVFAIGLGIWVGLGARRMIGSLSAVPGLANAAAGGGAMQRFGGSPSPLMMRLESRPALPFLKPKILEIPLSDIKLTTPVAPIAAGLDTSSASSFYSDITGADSPRRLTSAQIKRAQESQWKKDRETESYLKTLTKPITQVLGGLWKGIGRVVARDGFATVVVKGKGTWKMDARDGWLADEGVALDRLCRGK